MDFDIRQATAQDLERVLFLYREAGISAPADLSVQDATAILSKMSAYPNYKVFVAQIDGRIGGTFALLIMDNLAHGGMPSGIVEDVAVLPSLQGQGIGKKMMQYAMKRCRDHGCYKLVLSSNEMRTGAHKFYESLGFTRHGFSYKVDL